MSVSRAAGASLGDGHQPIGVFEWQRIHKDRACQGEHGGVGTDPEGQCQDQHGGETGRPQESTDGMSKVVDHGTQT